MSAAVPLWPLQGAWRLLTTPRWRLRPLLITTLAWLVLLGVSGATLWWTWPIETVTGWSRTWAIVWAIGVASATLFAAWLLVLPVLMWLAYEDLARQVQRAAGVEPVDLSLLRSLAAGTRVVVNTLPMRLGWIAAGLGTSLVIGPAGVVIGAIGMGQIACIDALDLALALRGLNGLERVAALQAHRAERLQVGVVAGLMHLGCAFTVVLWPLWLPSLVVGAAQRVLAWPEARITDAINR